MNAFLDPVGRFGRMVLEACAALGRLSIFGTQCLTACLSAPFYGREFAKQLFRIGYLSLPVVGLTAVFIGAALALNIYTGGARFNAEQFVPNIVALGITRELGPVFAGLMLAGRVSAGIAAEIGSMRVTQQIDALQTLSVSPLRFLYAPRVAAGVVALPLLVVVADIIGIFGGYLVAVVTLDFNGAVYIRNTVEFLETSDVVTGLIKAAVFGFIITVVGCHQGADAGGGATGVGRAATVAVVFAAMLIFTANYILTSLFVSFGL